MAKIDLPPFVHRYRDRHGRERFRFLWRRGARRVSVTLPPPWTPEFVPRYEAALARTEADETRPRPRRPAGSFGALVAAYFASPAFAEKAPSTRREYRRVLEALAAEHGDKPVAMLEGRNVRALRDARAETPAAANTLVRTLRLLLSWAVEEDWIATNPAAGVRLFRTGEWRAWTDEELAAFEARWPLGTMQRRAFAIALYTGQRRADQIAMRRQHLVDGGVLVRQAKTGGELWLPMHPALEEALAHGAPPAVMLLTTARGKPWQPQPYGAWCAEAIAAAGLPDDCVWHGLRKTAARRLAEAGCTVDEIRAVTGHATSAMATHYVRQADQRRMARAAIGKLRGTDGDR